MHEIDLLSKAESAYPPAFPQSGEYYSGRMLGSVPMKAPLSAGTSMGHRRDPVIEATTPMLNPAPDGNAVLRVICQTKPLSSESYQLLLDRVQVQTPPVTAWWECEDWTPRTTGDLTAQLPKYGRFTWSGWGALALAGREGGVMTVTMLAFTPAKPTALSLKGCLDPKMGAWYARVNGGEPVALRPGKDAQEVVEWTIPLAGITLPGPLTLEVTCAKTADPSRPGFRPPDAELTLDAWLAK
ncbi:MAG: hypothetical protein BWY76_03480 [bacterium ADurb.Bin429]|nr:MAG: hypothetical protein BWY76_03480 [bacterium ADurb.Bin429]